MSSIDPSPAPAAEATIPRRVLTPCDQDAARTLWEQYAEAHPVAASASPDFLVDQFGDHAELADELLELVLTGRKTSTASLLAEYVWEGETPPRIGAHTVFCDGHGAPRAIVRTIGLALAGFYDVDAEHAWAEGEGDRSLAQWRTEHRRFWERVCTAAGRSFSTDMEVLMERFDVVWAAPVARGTHYR
ncbi:ASCH domain-containing protein [Nesterenkonia sp. HG001]|uniref:ASCH domain-containing protein n=1 Tax=Nesterenkonia sp. HG001 TaxID=2983207 RepID=UPI002AC69CEA|nr:ASCH domain-containing protein [Nesterenkonia sp. HG001]MDZ5077659.1 ASCH domain-containing protein [Nesterenkonia sp. HG001]